MLKQIYIQAIEEGPSSSGSCLITLRDPAENCKLSIVIGRASAYTIQMMLDGFEPRRPMTHTLTQNILNAFGLHLTHISIDRVHEGIFYASLHISDGFNTKHIDSRPSDALTLALQANAPIMVEQKVLDEYGITESSVDNPQLIDSLVEELNRCLAAEEYEKAARIQEQIDQIEHQQD